MRRPKFNLAVIAGVGLIGGSLARDLKERGVAGRVLGYDTSRARLNRALRLKLIKGPARGRELAQADLVVFAAPVRAITRLIRKLAPRLNPDALVIDVGSVKRAIVDAASRAFPGGNFVGCHPMAGSENSGPEAAVAGLFSGKTCYLVPTSATKPRFVARALRLWRALGARPFTIAPETHDGLVARVSHLPQAVATVLATTVGDQSRLRSARGPALAKAIGKGFKDTTRLALSNAMVWRDIFLENRGPVLAALRAFRRELNRLEGAIARGDASAIAGILRRGAHVRRGLS